jgi:uncharacterized protein YyaL (SSP411 family)
MRNTLDEASSPYLQQHKHNPVHWQVWGPEALAAAKARNVPILLSIGYAACHWCHVMAHESFEDPAVAELMNTHYVNIKVDREERPDLDQLYMSALHAMGEQGGWPLTMVLTPSGDPFWGGTYFPPEPRFGRPSFTQVLTSLAHAWATDQSRIAETVTAMTRALTAQSATHPGAAPTPATLDAIRHSYLKAIDWRHGGIGTAPKFPNTPILRFLWQEAFRTQDAQAADAVTQALTAMAQGGIYDHLGGGFSRYATDERWLIPHFEKMLYDNALLLDLLALAHAETPTPLFAARAAETVTWLRQEMRTEGAWAASEDADSEGVEGKFYVWTLPEIETVLGPDTGFFAQHYPLPAHGNWEEKLILERITPLGPEAVEARLAALRARLAHHRNTRIRPGRDDKILTDWNALTIAALTRASAVFAEHAWLQKASTVFDYLLTTLGTPDGRLAHATRAGKISAAGLLEDQAAMIRAALALFEATGSEHRLTQAQQILSATEQHFADPTGAFTMSADDATDLPAHRIRTITDGPTPSGIGLMAENYARLHHLTGSPEARAKAQSILESFGSSPHRLAGSPTLLAAADLLENATTLVLTGQNHALTQAALASPDPATVVLHAHPGTDHLPPTHPAYGKSSPIPAAFICRGGTCTLPVTTPEELRTHLRQIRSLP